jgi:hypothetical protein
VDDYEGVDPEILEHYYGVAGPELHRKEGQTGAGHTEDDNDIELGLADASRQVEEEQQSNIRHEGVEAPSHMCPFETDIVESIFLETLRRLREQGTVPEGMGIHPSEWGNDGYPSYEIIRVGRKGKAELRVALPDEIWRPRALLWCQALDAMTCLQVVLEQ